MQDPRDHRVWSVITATNGGTTKFCRSRKSKLVNSFKDQKGKQKVDIEEIREDINQIWKKKGDDLLGEETFPSHSEENLASVT